MIAFKATDRKAGQKFVKHDLRQKLSWRIAPAKSSISGNHIRCGNTVEMTAEFWQDVDM